MEFSRKDTLDLLQAIAVFLRKHKALWSAHVVEFFQDRLWEDIDMQWWSDLECASIQDLLCLPSGKTQNTWCDSLKGFVLSAQSLALSRQPGIEIQKIFPDFHKRSISNVLRQGMNAKKLHEVEALSAVIQQLSNKVHATHIVDVGAGQGYLAQVLAFEYGLPVVALDACAHHADVTNKRIERIKKHYIARSMKASKETRQDWTDVSGPQTATFHVSSCGTQMELQHFLSTFVSEKVPNSCMEAICTENAQCAPCLAEQCGTTKQSDVSGSLGRTRHSFVLAGLHACGDLSAAMLKTYMMCDEVKAVVTVGCCYNLLSEGNDDDDGDEHATGSVFGFPLSEGVKQLGLTLGRRARDLACQSAERWEDVGINAALYNFEQHALRAGFQLVLHKYHPELAKCSPIVGRLGKARRRKQVRRNMLAKPSNSAKTEPEHPPTWLPRRNCTGCHDDTARPTTNSTVNEPDLSSKRKEFVEFCRAAFERLGLESVAEEELAVTWSELEAHIGLIGPYWSLRAVLGPVLETYILLDRLLYLQELHPEESLGGHSSPQQPTPEPRLVALFDPDTSPRNMAIVAMKS